MYYIVNLLFLRRSYLDLNRHLAPQHEKHYYKHNFFTKPQVREGGRLVNHFEESFHFLTELQSF